MAPQTPRACVARRAGSPVWSRKASIAPARLEELGPRKGTGIRRAGQADAGQAGPHRLGIGAVLTVDAGRAGAGAHRQRVLAGLAGHARRRAHRRDRGRELARRTEGTDLRVVQGVPAGGARVHPDGDRAGLRQGELAVAR